MTVLASSNLAAGTFTPSERIVGDSDVITNNFTIATAAGSLVAGTVLGRITATGKLIKSAIGAGDGSAVPVGILCEAVDASGGDKVASIYVAGEFALDFLVFDATYNTDALKLAAFGTSGSIIVRKLGYSG
jgi:hypothetical protein